MGYYLQLCVESVKTIELHFKDVKQLKVLTMAIPVLAVVRVEVAGRIRFSRTLRGADPANRDANQLILL